MNYQTVMHNITIHNSSAVREWCNANVSGKWFLVMKNKTITISFVEESDMIHFMLVKSELI